MIKNVIMVVLDTLQFNYLACYGNDWIQTPSIDRLAAEGILFENAYTEGSPTIPTRRAMMTGRYSLPFKGWGPLDPDDTTVADICMANQCRSALYYDTAPMHMYKYGYQRGFDEVLFRRGQELEQKEEIWTCTPGSTTEVPETDELYNRRDDPFQQNNLLEKHPDTGLEMLKKLREIMLELKTS
jgi:hypothetical protein